MTKYPLTQRKLVKGCQRGSCSNCTLYSWLCSEVRANYKTVAQFCDDCDRKVFVDEILRKQLIIHEFVPSCNGCACYWVAEFGGSLSAYEKWVEHFIHAFRPSNWASKGEEADEKVRKEFHDREEGERWKP
jgi:hypothetical protein